MYGCDIVQFKNSEKSSLFTEALEIILNYTDCSEPFVTAVSDSIILEKCKNIFETYREHHIEGKPLDHAVFQCLCIVHNISKTDENVDLLRNLGFINILKPYMMSDEDKIKIPCLVTLANLVNEEECAIIKANKQNVVRLLEVLCKALADKNRKYMGWSCRECVLAIRKLAKNDANKHILWSVKAISLLVKFTKTGDEEEQLEGVLALWTLAFDSQIKKDMAVNVEQGVVELLVQLKRLSENKKLNDACERCLWILRKELKEHPVKENKEAVKEIEWKQDTEEKEVKEGHIMISYQSRHRDILRKIRDNLKDQNYKVWMDVDQMGGSTLQAMARAIENASVVLICYCRRYKESQYCQSEADYAYSLKKPIIPLKMEQGYTPDGWLGILLGQKYYVEFSGKYDFNDKVRDLFKELRGIVELEPDETGNLPKPNVPVSTEEDTVLHAPLPAKNAFSDTIVVTKTLSFVRQWTQDDITNWLKKHNLQSQGLDDLTGDEVILLAKMHLETPERLFKRMKHQLNLNTLIEQSRLVYALYDITNPQ